MKKHSATMSITTIAIFLSFMTTLINHSSSARTLMANIPTHNHHKLTFLMQHHLNTTTTTTSTSSSSQPITTNNFPFSKPLGIFPPNKGIPVPQYPTDQTLDLSSIGLSFPSQATLQDLEFGKITLIDQELVAEEEDGNFKKLGRGQGVYVASSEDGRSSHMMAMTANFGKGEGDEDDGLRLFGVHRSDVFESHVAVIGGTGKYEDANGYAAVKVVNRVGFGAEKAKVTSQKFLCFDVFLS